MLDYREGKWIIEVERDFNSGKIEALITDLSIDESWYLIEEDLENDINTPVPLSIITKAREMVNNGIELWGE